MNGRIEFIDLAKGVCILLVILVHCGINAALPCFNSIRMPLYFALSGMFFKTYGGFSIFAKKKTNKLLIPFAFFYLLGYAIYYTIGLVSPQTLDAIASNGIFDVFTQNQFFNGPIWFLLSLFWTNLIFYAVCKVSKRNIVQLVIVFVIGTVGCYLGKLNIFVPCMIIPAMTAMPIFYFGYTLMTYGEWILHPQKYDKYNVFIALTLYVSAAIIDYAANHPLIALHSNSVYGSPIGFYVIAALGILAILFLCKAIGRLPFVSYFGRYSIIPLCVHHLINRPLNVICLHFGIPHQAYVTAALTVLLCWACIPFCIRFLPHVTAQKDVIKSSLI